MLDLSTICFISWGSTKQVDIIIIIIIIIIIRICLTVWLDSFFHFLSGIILGAFSCLVDDKKLNLDSTFYNQLYFQGILAFAIIWTIKFPYVPTKSILWQNVKSHTSTWKYWLRWSESVSWNPVLHIMDLLELLFLTEPFHSHRWSYLNYIFLQIL